MKKWKVCLLALMVALSSTGCVSMVAKAASVVEGEGIEEIPAVSPQQTQLVGQKESVIEYDGNLAFVLEYPRIGNTLVDEEIEKIIDEIREDFALQYQTKNEKQKKRSTQKDCDSFLYLNYDSYIASEDKMTLVFRETQEISTMASSATKIHIYHFDLNTGARLGTESFIKEGFREKASAYTIKYFTTTAPYKESLFGDYATTLVPESGRFDRFALTADGILFYFDRYDIFPGSFGDVELLIPYEELRGTLNGVGLEALPVEEKVVVVPPTGNGTGDTTRAIDPNKPMVALTYDDGPNPKNTGRILDALEKHGAVATFFDLGSLVAAHPAVVQRELDLGCEVGSHSYSHKNFNKLTKAEILEDVALTADAFQNAVGFQPILFRPPYGNCNDAVQAVMPLAMVTWSVDTLDWKSKNVNEIMKTVKTEADLDGRVILMHGIYETSANATEKLIPYLLEQGYQLVTVSELLKYKHNITPQGGTYYGYTYFQ